MNNTKKSAFHMALKTLPQFFSLLYKNDKKYLFLMLLETAAFSIDKYPALLIMKYSVDALTDHIVYWEYVRTVIPLIAIMLTLKMLRVIVNTTRPFRDQVITENLFNAFFAKCMKMDYQTLENKEMQDKKELAKYITDGKIAAVGWYFVEMFSSLIAMIIAAVFMIRINGLVLIIVICGSSVKLFLGKKHTDQTVPITKQQVIENRYLSYLYNIGSEYEYVKEFRIFQYRENLYQKISGAKQNYITNNDKLLKVNLFHSLAHNIEDFIVKLLSFGIMGFTCFASKVTIGDFTYMIGLVNDFMSYADSFVSSCKSYAEAVAYVGYYVESMSCNDILYLPEERAMQISAKPHVIEFQNVYFKYPNRDTYALKNINLKIETPVRISLVGRNGAGKSTLVKLLLRLYKPDQGQILLDGVSIYGYTNEDYMMLFSTVFQDFTLFAFTVSDNITSFDADANQHLFNRISAETGVADFIGNYPDRYDTYLTNVYSDNGVEFSGGEQQKIALARSMYKDSAQFFALDEPTAAYDADAEYRLYRKYEKMLMGKVSIFISHRLSSCRLSDHIILLDNGEVIEEGSHAELMSHNTQYKHMYELQANQYNWGENNDE